jgi:polysaccharide export outer membrane protein
MTRLAGAVLAACILIGAGCGLLPKRVAGPDGNPPPGDPPGDVPGLKVSPPTAPLEDGRPLQERAAYKLRPLDPIRISLRGPTEKDFEEVIDEKGFVNLPYVGRVMAAGKTASELGEDVQRLYVMGEIYKYVNVNVVAGFQYFYIRGEVKQPGKYPLIGGMTILQAITTAKGYTEFANPKKVVVYRGGSFFEVNAREIQLDREPDIDVESGDVIVVARSPW